MNQKPGTGARQMPLTLDSEMPISRAILLRGQCVAPAGLDVGILATME